MYAPKGANNSARRMPEFRMIVEPRLRQEKAVRAPFSTVSSHFSHLASYGCVADMVKSDLLRFNANLKPKEAYLCYLINPEAITSLSACKFRKYFKDYSPPRPFNKAPKSFAFFCRGADGISAEILNSYCPRLPCII